MDVPAEKVSDTVGGGATVVRPGPATVITFDDVKPAKLAVTRYTPPTVAENVEEALPSMLVSEYSGLTDEYCGELVENCTLVLSAGSPIMLTYAVRTTGFGTAIPLDDS